MSIGKDYGRLAEKLVTEGKDYMLMNMPDECESCSSYSDCYTNHRVCRSKYTRCLRELSMKDKEKGHYRRAMINYEWALNRILALTTARCDACDDFELSEKDKNCKHCRHSSILEVLDTIKGVY